MDTCVQIPVRDGRNLQTRPWRHQVNAIDFLQRTLRRDGGGALLAMGMGTGKSLVGVSMACNLPIDAEPLVLIACPLRVVEVWPGQFERHAGRKDLTVLALGDNYSTVGRKRDAAELSRRSALVRGDRLVVVVNYESLWRPPLNQWVLAQKWGIVVLDESHRVKQPSGKASMFCFRLRAKARFRLALTGTPMPHSPLDIYAQFRFINPSVFGTNYHAFKQEFAVHGGYLNKQIVGFRNLDVLQHRMEPWTFRVGKEVLDLPEETHVTYHCNLSAEGTRVYVALEREFVADVRNGLITAANAMVKLLRLQQVTGGTVKTDDGQEIEVCDAKRKLLVDTLEDIAADEAVVVFCRFRSDLDNVHKAAKDLGRKSLELSGRRDELAEWQQDGAPPILAVQIQAGGVGVDMTRARYSIYYSVGYSLGDYDQSLARIHRPGQTRPVTHIHLAVKGTVDERVMRALEARRDVVDSVLNELRENNK